MSTPTTNAEDYYIDENINENTEPTDADNDTNVDSEKQLNELLEQKKRLEELERQEKEEQEKIKREFIEHMENVKNNINIFLVWSAKHYAENDYYKNFSTNFSNEYRMELFENVCEFFKDDTLITDDVLWYWKVLIVNVIKSNKKYKYYIDNKNKYFEEEFVFDINNRVTNLNIVKEKHIFRCFVGEEPICYFKENGNEYYAS